MEIRILVYYYQIFDIDDGRIALATNGKLSHVNPPTIQTILQLSYIEYRYKIRICAVRV
jgi:hypothetical protein